MMMGNLMKMTKTKSLMFAAAACVGLAWLAQAATAQSPTTSPAPTSPAPVYLPKMVVIPGQSFEVGRLEVTFDEWDACFNDGGCNGYRPSSEGWGRGDRPVINVSWDDAKAYVQWLNRRTGQSYRLLTSAEWEIAARAGSTTLYSWGDQDPVCDPRAPNGANSDPCPDDRTWKVGSFQPNKFRLFDMHGNVWEWVEDADGPTRRIFRGGGWNGNPFLLRSAFTNSGPPNTRNVVIGFRLARDVPKQAAPAPAPAPTAGAFMDARTTPSSTRAPLVANPTSLPDYALFRECDDCPDMVVIPAGSFTMGSLPGVQGRDKWESPQLSVSITRFAISRFETTWEQWTACVNAGTCNQSLINNKIASDTTWNQAYNWGQGKRPVIMVSFDDTFNYLDFVRTKALVNCTGCLTLPDYRLPTESEWEYSARAGTTTRWSFGDAEHENGKHLLSDYAVNSRNSDQRTQPVGSKKANPWGLFDMHGNVWEMVQDCWNNSLTNTPTIGTANRTGACTARVVKGSYYSMGGEFMRSAVRGPGPMWGDVITGFRLARTL
jgi:formylglycine-generating enzyme required for sulfatase activity